MVTKVGGHGLHVQVKSDAGCCGYRSNYSCIHTPSYMLHISRCVTNTVGVFPVDTPRGVRNVRQKTQVTVGPHRLHPATQERGGQTLD